MDYIRNTVAGVMFGILLVGCSAINVMFDDKEVFVNERNSDVGKSITKILESTKYYEYWEDQSAPLKKEYKVVKIGGNQTEYHFEKGSCRWALIVKNKVVTKWRYVRQTQDCGYKQFHEGPF